MTDLNHFFPPAFELSVGKIRDLLADSVSTEDSNDLPLAGVCQASIPTPSALTFVEAAKHAHEGLAQTGAVLVREADAPHIPAGPTVIKTKSPHLAFASILAALYPTALGSAGILNDDDHWVVRDDGAHVASTAVIEKNVRLSPGAVIGSRVQIGSGSVIGACAVIASGCMIGRNCNIGPSSNVQYAFIGDNVILHAGVCVGQDGFGYRPGPSGLHKVPQIGRVIIQNGVEIGSNTAVDRGAIGDTVIGENSKIDNLVQIGHNVVVGRNAIICAHAGLSGSCVVGDGAMLGGGAGIADHIHVGAGAQVAAAAGVMNDIPAGERWGGTPAQPLRAFFRELTALRSLVKNNKG